MQEGVKQPRLRVNKTTSLNLTTSWQDVVFNGTSTYNTNTFGIDPVSGNKMLYYDSANNLFKFYDKVDKNYSFTFYVSTTATLISTGNTIQYRMVIPNGISAGVDLYFPFPDSGGYSDLSYIALKTGTVNHNAEPIAVYINDQVRTNGLKVQVRLSSALVGIGAVTMDNAAMLIQA